MCCDQFLMTDNKWRNIFVSVCVQAEPSRQLFIIKRVMTALWQSNKKQRRILNTDFDDYEKLNI